MEDTTRMIRKIAVAALAGYALCHSAAASYAGISSTEHRLGGYRLINPLLECEPEESKFKLLLPFQYKLEKLIAQKSMKKATLISVYFRDLNNGPWFGIKEDENFSPASLLKVPLMMGYFHAAEDNPEILTRMIRFEKSVDLNQSELIKPSVRMENGKLYTVDNLIYRMIVYSDNDAANLLIENTSLELFTETYRALGIEVPGVRQAVDFMTVREYASFFRILFNASYLSKKYSEKALDYLSQVQFKDGLAAGVPHNVTVAHKFGERRLIRDEDSSQVSIQLHDCGIVYFPNHPYLLCVMTRGNDISELSDVIKNVSRFVFDETERQMKSQ